MNSARGTEQYKRRWLKKKGKTLNMNVDVDVRSKRVLKPYKEALHRKKPADMFRTFCSR